ncbi:MAG: hypothetical protein A2562_03995 [Candidatus Nealsonbacteria bacterium RIFOXYD1_FULL_39_11]|nr:MAG: hypothetical protein A2562_03995 [Candidatus Nealsonbacteria bacterium RIFOXYD1_FULL_39_11]
MTWPTKKLGEVADIVMGQSPPSSSYNERGEGLPFFQGKAEFGEIYPTPVKYCSSPSRIAEANDVLMSVRAPVGNINIAKEKSCVGRGLGALRTKKNILNQMFLFYFMKKNENNWSRLSTGSTFSAIKGSNLRNFEIQVPPLEIQKQIVERLDKVAEAQKLNDELIQKTDELFQSLLHKELNPAGKDWEVKKLGEVCEKTDQGQPKNFFKKEFRYIDISSINAEAKEIQDANLIPVDGAPSRARKIVRAGDIIFATTRPYLENIATVPAEFNNAIASTGFCVIRANIRIANPDFIYFTVISKPFIKKVLPFQRGANYPAVSDKDIFDIKISLPSLQIQKQIVAKLSAVQDYKKQLLEQKAKLKELFDSVLSKSMKGE